MGKTMALIADGVVENLIWCTNDTKESHDLVNVWDLKVRIGDLYENGQFIRNGFTVKSTIEELTESMAKLAEQLDASYTEDSLTEAYLNGVNSI